MEDPPFCCWSEVDKFRGSFSYALRATSKLMEQMNVDHDQVEDIQKLLLDIRSLRDEVARMKLKK